MVRLRGAAAQVSSLLRAVRRAARALLLAGSVVAAACSDGSSGTGAAADAGDPSDGSSADAAPPINPSGYLLITAERLEGLHDEVAAEAARWQTLRQNVDEEMDERDSNRCGPENIALAYLLTAEPAYASAAMAWADEIVDADDVAFDSYLYFGDRMRQIALVLNYAYDALDAAERQRLQSYLERWTHELWFDNQGSGWGLDDPGNNYHMAFLEGTAYAGYALRQAGVAQGQSYVDVLLDKIERPGGVLEYLQGRARGGDWPEGVNYGQRSKQRLFSALSAVASMGDTNYFAATSFFSEAISYAFYQLQPGGERLYPGGDLAWDEAMPVSPNDREYVQMATYWMTDPTGQALGQWYLEHVVPDYTGPTFHGRSSYYLDLLFARQGPSTPPTELPLHYLAEGTLWAHVRSSWDDDATSLSISGMPLIDQSHAHYDVGSFTLWKHGWLAVDATSYGDTGLNWDSGAHNMVHVAGHERRGGEIPGLLRFGDEPEMAYAQVDASGLYRRKQGAEVETLLEEYTRELVYLKPNTLVVYDRVEPKPAGSDYDFRVHFAAEPSQAEGRISAQNGGGAIALELLVGGDAEVRADDDLAGGPSDAWRVEVEPGPGGRFLAVLEVATGSPPAPGAEHLTSSGEAEGALIGDEVVLFSSRPRGQSPALPFNYAVTGTEERTHTIANLDGPCAVSVDRQGGSTLVTVSAGSSHTPDDQGVLRFAD